MNDIGLTHIALQVKDIKKSIAFYKKYAAMQIVHERKSEETGQQVVWISDKTRPFVIVLIESDNVDAILFPFAHLGVGCKSREEVDLLCAEAKAENVLIKEPKDSGYPVGYWAFLKDPDGHTLELSFGQEVGLTVEQASEL
jgi:catechol 2,3-dioxygenase-like lactoylglutathione lyase family enzyme